MEWIAYCFNFGVKDYVDGFENGLNNIIGESLIEQIDDKFLAWVLFLNDQQIEDIVDQRQTYILCIHSANRKASP